MSRGDRDAKRLRRRPGFPIRRCAGEDVQHERRFRSRPRQGAELGHAVPVPACAARERHDAGPRLQADEPAACGRHAQRAASVRAERQRRHAGGHRDRSSAGRAAGRKARVERVLRGRERLGPGERPHRELRHLRLADDNAARIAQPPHELVVALDGPVRGRGRALACRQAGDVDVVLDRDRNTGERERRVDAGGLCERLLASQRLEGVEAWLELVDACEAFACRECAVHGRILARMRAMVLEQPGLPLELRDLPAPEAGAGQLRLRVRACAVCRTDLHVVDGELPHPKLPLVIGHQIVGGTEDGGRLGVPWLGWTDGTCHYCTSGRENLCDHARFTGYDLDGGYAEYVVADERYCLELPDVYDDVQVAPLLCAGLIGYRSLRLAGDAERLGLYGFGASAHIVAQVARHQGRRLFGFVRPGDDAARAFALELGCEWAGWSNERPPEELDAAIVFAPVGALVPAALAALAKGRTVV